MNRSDLPRTAFIDPTGGNLEEVRALAERVLERVLQEAATATTRPPMPDAPTLAGIPTDVPDAPLNEDQLLEHLTKLIQGSMNPTHPGYLGHMDSVPTTASVMGELAAAAVNNNLLSLEMSPVFSRLEVSLTEEMARRFGLGDQAGGVMSAGGSLANLHALAVARNVAFGTKERGVVGLSKGPVILTSEMAHTSVQKAAMLLGLGTEAVIPVETDRNARMDVSDLVAKLERAKREGRAPFCVVATAGTTVTGSLDPLADIADVTQAHRLWLHVDAAYGGALVFSERYKGRLEGIERADSITFNPQKWLYVAKTCAMALFRDVRHLHEHFRVGAPYMADTSGLTNLGEIGVQGTRHADALKLWLSLQHLGGRGYAQLIEESYRLSAYVVGRVKERPSLELATEPDMNLVCFRVAPEGLEDRWDELNAHLQAHLLREANIFLSLPLLRGDRWLRLVLLNPYTDEGVLAGHFRAVDAFVERHGVI